TLQLYDLLDKGRKSLQDQVKDTARLTGLNHVGIQLIEDFRMSAHGRGQRRSLFHILAHLRENLLEIFVRLLLSQDIETLDQRQAGVDHDRELAREDRKLL